jgi:hypothetical protein
MTDIQIGREGTDTIGEGPEDHLPIANLVYMKFKQVLFAVIIHFL